MLYLCIAAAIATILYYNTNFYIGFSISILFYIIIQHRWIYIFVKTLPRDVRLVVWIVKAFRKAGHLCKGNKSIGEIFSVTAKINPGKVAIISVDRNSQMTFKEIDELSNKIGNIFHQHGFVHGDVIGLYMLNEIEFVPIWLGLSKIGVITALINTNLKGETLLHSIKVANPKAIFSQTELKENINTIKEKLSSSMSYYLMDGSSKDGYIDMELLLKTAPSFPPPRPPSLTSDDVLFYIYTSGTSGLPKAAILPSSKVVRGTCVFNIFTSVNSDDVVYNVLPMYHTSGSVIFSAQMLTEGCTMVIRKKFSASHFFQDCARYKVTYIGYIGEMCRYLLKTPPSSQDRSHQVKVAFGNGMRSNLCREFKQRYGINLIYEFYGSTEGNVGFVNITNEDGAVGFLFKSLWFLNHSNLVRVNPETRKILRGKNGLAIPCRFNEPGFLVCVIKMGLDFHGYVDRKASEKKIARNIFRKGDSVFMTGDLLIADEFGHLRFFDRLGDTYRWKGENSSPTQIENIISRHLNFSDVIVYPVAVPQHEGKAGMAFICIKPNEKFDLYSLTDNIRNNLPVHSIPVFLRIGSSIDVTGTQKYQKGKLKEEGFDLKYITAGEKIYFYDVNEQKYDNLTRDVYEMICDGKVRF